MAQQSPNNAIIILCHIFIQKFVFGSGAIGPCSIRKRKRKRESVRFYDLAIIRVSHMNGKGQKFLEPKTMKPLPHESQSILGISWKNIKKSETTLKTVRKHTEIIDNHKLWMVFFDLFPRFSGIFRCRTHSGSVLVHVAKPSCCGTVAAWWLSHHPIKPLPQKT